MFLLVIDTNNWIYLANSRNPNTDNFEDEHHFKLFKTLLQNIEEKKIQLLVCSVIENEWVKNKNHAESLIEKYRTEINTCKANIKYIKKHLDLEVDKIKSEDLLSKCLLNIEKKIDQNKEHINQIEELILNSKKFEITNNVKIFSADWAVEKKAPFIGDKKNSMADAYIFFGAIEYIKEYQSSFPWEDDLIPIFVSSNKGDFCDKSNEEKLHPDLISFADEVGLLFYKNLLKALNFVQATFEKVESVPIFDEDEIRLFEEDWEICQACNNVDRQIVNFVFLSDPIEIDRDVDIDKDPNQLVIDFKDIDIIHNLKKTKIRIGECDWCNTLHVKCLKCDTVTGLYGSDETDFVCEGCETHYSVEFDHENYSRLVIEITQYDDSNNYDVDEMV